MPLQTIVYCSIAQLDRFMSSNATTDFADHDADGTADTDVIEDCINQATDETDLYARQQYTPAVLACIQRRRCNGLLTLQTAPLRRFQPLRLPWRMPRLGPL